MAAGRYVINATYKGDNNHTAAYRNGTPLTVTEGTDYELEIEVHDVYVGQNATVIVYVPTGATGTVLMKLSNGSEYNAPIIGNKATWILPITKEGLYIVNATYSSTQFAEKNVTAAFRAFKVSTPISIEVNDTVVGNVTKVIVTVPENVTKVVTIEIDGQILTNTSVGGKAVFHITGLTAGDKTITATYAGDNKYLFNSTTRTFVVSKLASFVNVTTKDIDVDDTAVINITTCRLQRICNRKCKRRKLHCQINKR